MEPFILSGRTVESQMPKVRRKEEKSHTVQDSSFGQRLHELAGMCLMGQPQATADKGKNAVCVTLSEEQRIPGMPLQWESGMSGKQPLAESGGPLQMQAWTTEAQQTGNGQQEAVVQVADARAEEAHAAGLVQRTESGSPSAKTVQLTESQPSAKTVQLTESQPSAKTVQLTESQPSAKTVQLTESHPSAKTVQPSESQPSAKTVQQTESHPSAEMVQPSESHPSAEAVQQTESHPSAEAVQQAESHPSAKTVQPSESHPSAEAVQPSESHPIAKAVQLSESHPSAKAVQQTESHPSAKTVQLTESHPAEKQVRPPESRPAAETGQDTVVRQPEEKADRKPRKLQMEESGEKKAIAAEKERVIPEMQVQKEPDRLAGEVEKAAVKAPVTTKDQMDPEYERVIRSRIAKEILAGKKEIEIHLTPRHLGDILVKVAKEAGSTSVSIICSGTKAMQAMSQKAEELGQILEAQMGSRIEVVVDMPEQKESSYPDGQQGNGSANEQEQKGHDQKKKRDQEREAVDFLQQLRLGLT